MKNKLHFFLPHVLKKRPFFNKVREGYLKIAEENRERIYKANGIDTIENIHKRILEHVGEKIGSSLG